MLHFKGQSAPSVLDLHGFLQAFRDKEEGARAEVKTFMEHCGKRWQTKEGAYQLKRRRLLSDVSITGPTPSIEAGPPPFKLLLLDLKA